MKRVNDEKILGPMFPRVHVNDTDKGGPKAPPRNKMALYEQLSIPSNKFTHAAANSVHPSSQGVANEKGVFFSSHPPTRSQPEKQYTHQYSNLSTPLSAQIEGRKNPEDDEFTVPIFVRPVRSQECDEFNFNHRSKCQKSEKTDPLESKSRKEENLEKIATDRIKPVSNFLSTVEKPPELCGGYKSESTRCNTTSVLEESNIAVLGKRNDSNLAKAFLSEEGQKILHGNSNKMGFQSGPGRPRQINLERVDCLSENSVVDSISGLDITPDDVVGIIGQKHFWKARREIVNQQRIFAVQIFELHRLIKVQKLIAASPHILLEDSAFFTKPIKALPGKRKPLNFPVKEIPQDPKQKTEPEKQVHKNKSPPENTTSKASFSAVQTGIPPPSFRPVSGNSRAQSISSDYTPGPWGFNPPPAPIGNQWLIPVMSPSEGLVYKPYPGPGFVGPACGPPGPNPMMGHFPTPAYGNPAPHHQYQPPSFPRAGPHGYFPPYGMPVTNIAAFPGSSAKQANGTPFSNQILAQDPNLAAIPGRKNKASKDMLDNLNVSEDIEAQDSIASSPVERLQDNGESKSMTERNVLPLFPTSPPVDGPEPSSRPPEPERPAQVIKVVPHHAKSASESAARIFLSLQEGRKQYDPA